MKIIKLLACLIFLFTTYLSHAQDRGVLKNVWASWVNVGTTLTVLEFPYPSRDVIIQNGSANEPCINLQGESILHNCLGSNDTFNMNANSEITLNDYVTSSISMKMLTSTASPVSVIITY